MSYRIYNGEVRPIQPSLSLNQVQIGALLSEITNLLIKFRVQNNEHQDQNVIVGLYVCQKPIGEVI